MKSAFDVANYFIRLADDDSGELLSNMKLQKLLYYAQGFHIALYDKPLFKEKIFAWIHGPVVGEVYYKYQKFGNAGIPADDADTFDFSSEDKELLDEIFTVYGQFSAWKLRELTHEEPPWKDTPNGMEISHIKLKSYFETQVQND